MYKTKQIYFTIKLIKASSTESGVKAHQVHKLELKTILVKQGFYEKLKKLARSL